MIDMTKRTNMDAMLEMTMMDTMKEVKEMTLVKYVLEVFRSELTRNLVSARADQEHFEFSIAREGRLEEGFKILLRRSG